MHDPFKNVIAPFEVTLRPRAQPSTAVGGVNPRGIWHQSAYQCCKIYKSPTTRFWASSTWRLSQICTRIFISSSGSQVAESQDPHFHSLSLSLNPNLFHPTAANQSKQQTPYWFTTHQLGNAQFRPYKKEFGKPPSVKRLILGRRSFFSMRNETVLIRNRNELTGRVWPAARQARRLFRILQPPLESRLSRPSEGRVGGTRAKKSESETRPNVCLVPAWCLWFVGKKHNGTWLGSYTADTMWTPLTRTFKWTPPPPPPPPKKEKKNTTIVSTIRSFINYTNG